MPDLQPRARELRARPAARAAQRHEAHAADVEHDFFAREARLEVEEF